MKNQKGDHVAKQIQKTKKDIHTEINQLGNAVGDLYRQLHQVHQNLVGLESLTIHLSEFLGKKEDFGKYLDKQIAIAKEEEERKKEEIRKASKESEKEAK